MDSHGKSWSRITLTPYSRNDLKEIMKEAIMEMDLGIQQKVNNGEEDFLSQRDAARFLRVSLATIIKWKKDGKIPYYQQGRTILYKKSELLEAMRKNDKLIK